MSFVASSSLLHSSSFVTSPPRTSHYQEFDLSDLTSQALEFLPLLADSRYLRVSQKQQIAQLIKDLVEYAKALHVEAANRNKSIEMLHKLVPTNQSFLLDEDELNASETTTSPTATEIEEENTLEQMLQELKLTEEELRKPVSHVAHKTDVFSTTSEQEIHQFIKNNMPLAGTSCCLWLHGEGEVDKVKVDSFRQLFIFHAPNVSFGPLTVAPSASWELCQEIVVPEALDELTRAVFAAIKQTKGKVKEIGVY